MTDLHDDLVACGLAPAGDPPAVTVDVTGYAVRVAFVETGTGQVRLEATVTTGTPPADEALADASRHAPGDTAFVVDGGAIVGRRTLVSPPQGALRDATFELAKLVLGLRRSCIDERDAEAAAPPSAMTEPTPVVTAASAAQPAQAPNPQPGGDATPFWFFVDQPTPLQSTTNPSETVAMLQPGVWYEARSAQGDWVLATHPSGAEGWVALAAVNRT